jgi:tape measure domain-containing protein
MARNARLNATLVLDTSAFQQSMRRIERDLQAFSRKVTEVGSTLTQSLTLPLIGVGAAALKSFADIEKLEKGMTAVTGSTEAAAVELEKLKIAARAPGLGFEEAVRGSIRLQAVGLSADEARQTLQAFGSAIAATGGTAQNLDSVQYQLTQMISKNRILQQDFGIIQENVPLIGKAVQAAFGTKSIDKIRDTGVSAQEFNRRIVEALQNLPEVQRATGGLSTAFGNFQDEVKIAVAELGRAIAANFDLAGILARVTEGLNDVVDWFKRLSPETQKNIIAFGALVAAIGPALIAIGALTRVTAIGAVGLGTLAKAATFLASPIGIAALAIGTLGLVIFKAFQNYKKLNPEVETFNDYVSDGAKNIMRERSEFDLLVKQLSDANISTETRKRLINELNTNYSTYLPRLITEKDTIKDIKELQEGANVAFEQKIKLAALEGIVEKQKTRLVDLAEEQIQLESELARRRAVGAPATSIYAKAERSYGQTAAINTQTAIQYAASLRDLETQIENNKNAQKALTAESLKSQNVLSELITSLGIEPVVPTSGGGGDGTGTQKVAEIDLSEQDTLRAQLFRTQKALTDLGNVARSSLNSVRSNLADLGKSTPIINVQKEALLEYEKGLKAINDTAAVFKTNPLEETFKATEEALKNAIVQFGPASEAVRVLAAEYERLKAEIEEANNASQRQADLGQIIATTITSIGQNFSDAIAGVVSFGKAAQKVLIDLIGAIVQLIVVRAIEKTIDSPLGKLLGGAIVPVAIAAGAAAGQLTKALLSTIKLADGGLTTGETLAIVGDNPSGREFIIPFERMGEFLSNFQQDGGFVAEARISGNDLALLVTRAERRTNRVR